MAVVCACSSNSIDPPSTYGISMKSMKQAPTSSRIETAKMTRIIGDALAEALRQATTGPREMRSGRFAPTTAAKSDANS